MLEDRVWLKIKGKAEREYAGTTHPDGGSDDVFQAWIKQQAQMQQEESKMAGGGISVGRSLGDIC